MEEKFKNSNAKVLTRELRGLETLDEFLASRAQKRKEVFSAVTEMLRQSWQEPLDSDAPTEKDARRQSAAGLGSETRSADDDGVFAPHTNDHEDRYHV